METSEGTDDLAQGVKEVASEATASPAVDALLRLGYVVRGLLYGVIGLLALRVVIGGRGQFTDTQGAIAMVARTQWASILLYIILAGLIGFGFVGPSFPSGHTISAVMCYGLLAYLVAPKLRSGRAKAAVIALAVLLVLFVGFSRVFIGDHYLTDVLAGIALGIAWASLVYTTVELVDRSRMKQKAQRNAT